MCAQHPIVRQRYSSKVNKTYLIEVGACTVLCVPHTQLAGSILFFSVVTRYSPMYLSRFIGFNGYRAAGSALWLLADFIRFSLVKQSGFPPHEFILCALFRRGFTLCAVSQPGHRAFRNLRTRLSHPLRHHRSPHRLWELWTILRAMVSPGSACPPP